jgi:hypothetical protein
VSAILAVGSRLATTGNMGATAPTVQQPDLFTLVARPRTFTLTAQRGYAGGFGMASALTVVPAPVQQATAETITWTVDCTPVVPSGQNISSATAVLYDTTSGGRATIPGLAAPTVSGLLVSVSLVGTLLLATHTYEVVFVLTLSGGMKPAVEVDLVVPY